MKRFLVLLVAVLMCSMVAGPAFAAQKWKVAHIRPADSEIDKELTWFANEIREATKGEIDIQIFGSSQLGDYTVVQERVGIGSVEMSCESVATQVDKKLLIATMQYIFFDYDSAKKNIATGAPLANYMDSLFKKQDIKVLAWWPVYFGGIGLTKEPADPKNPNAPQKLKVRVPTMKTFEVMANSIGYQATPLPFSEFFTAAQTGMVEGIVGGGAESYYSNFKDLIRYYVPANTHFEVWPLLINAELYDSLSQEYKDILTAKAAEFEARRWTKAEQDQTHYEELLAQAGCTIIPLNTEELKAFADKGREVVFPEFKKVVGDAAYKEIFDTIVLE